MIYRDSEGGHSMLILELYCSNQLSRVDFDSIERTWNMKDDLCANITVKNLEISPTTSHEYRFENQRIVYIRASIEGNTSNPYLTASYKMLAHLIFRINSGLILVDTRGRVEIAEILMDFLEGKLNINIRRVEPSSTMWLSFLKRGRLSRATVSTRYGFKEVTSNDKDLWRILEENPIITAQFNFSYPGDEYNLQLSEGFLIVHHKKNPDRLEHVSRAIEESLMDGECIANSV